ncbi:MAG: hypothetical protein ACRCTJ_07530 [Brevinema sp.]
MKMFDAETSKQMSRILEDIVNPVKILLFLGNNEKSKETEQFVKEFVEFSPKLSLETFSPNDVIMKKDEWEIIDTPMIIVTNEHKTIKGVRFLGTPGGFEINSFLMSILEVSGKMEFLEVSDRVVVDRLRKPLEIFAYVSLNCAKCPKSVMNIHRLALENQYIRAYMIEAPAFRERTESCNIQAFPTIRIGEKLLIGDNCNEISGIVKLMREFI